MAQWTKSVVPSNLKGIIGEFHFISPNEGWAVGGYAYSSGIILHTIDSGKTWMSQTSPLDQQLYSVHFTSNLIGYAVGLGTDLLYTTDGGAIWKTKSIGATTGNFSKIFFTSTTTGFILTTRGVVYKTIDAGASWQSKSAITNPNPSTYTILADDMFCTNSNELYVVGGLIDFSTSTPQGIVSKSSDGGSSWNQQTITTTSLLTSIHFASNLVGYLSNDEGEILKTVDAGNTWTPKAVLSNNAFIHDIKFTSTNEGWACEENNLYYTNNGYDSWTNSSSLSANESAASLYFVDKQLGFIGGGQLVSGSNKAFIYRTISGGLLSNKESYYENQISVYPNPATNYLNIDMSTIQPNIKNPTIDVIDVCGKVIANYNLKNSTSKENSFYIDISPLKSGIYFIRIDNFYKKIVKE